MQGPGGHFAGVVTLGGMNTLHKLKIWLVACLCMWTCTLMAQTDSTRYVCITLQSGIMRCGTLTMDDGREVGEGDEDEVGCGELDLVVLSWLRLP